MNKEKIQGIVLFAIIIILVVGSISFAVIRFDRTMIESAMRTSRMSIDTEALERVKESGMTGYNLLQNDDYKKIVDQLKAISGSFSLPAKWSYIADVGVNENNATLAVLTIHAMEQEETTLPGYLYDISKYPAMQKAIYTDADIVVSSIVFDSTYGFLTRSGFAKLLNKSGEVVGVLGVDIKTNHVIMQLVYLVLFSLGGVAAICIAVFKVSIGFGLMLNQREWEKVQKRGC